MANSRTYPLLKSSGRAIVDFVEARRGPAFRRARATRARKIRLHDTMAREKRDFVPADPERVTMYVCGPTVYNRAHIGNARPYGRVRRAGAAAAPRLRRRQRGLCRATSPTSTTRSSPRRAPEGVPIESITDRYEPLFSRRHGARSASLPPDVMPRATQHIAEMIAMIERLIAAGHAYAAEGHVLFDVPSDARLRQAVGPLDATR